jgi:hypothetical protein
MKPFLVLRHPGWRETSREAGDRLPGQVSLAVCSAASRPSKNPRVDAA